MQRNYKINNMSCDNTVLIPFLKARIIIGKFLVRMCNADYKNEVVMKVVELNCINTLEVCLFSFCTNIVLRFTY